MARYIDQMDARYLLAVGAAMRDNAVIGPLSPICADCRNHIRAGDRTHIYNIIDGALAIIITCRGNHAIRTGLRPHYFPPGSVDGRRRLIHQRNGPRPDWAGAIV